MRRTRRRLLAGITVVVALLVLGRWSASFVTARLWEARVSESAALVGTRFALLGAALELAGLVIAIGWFVGHFVWATRAVVLQFGDAPRPLGYLSERTVYPVAAGLGVIIGAAVGSGSALWLPAVLLDLADVRFGVSDLLLQTDLGLFAAKLPMWELLYERAFALILPALLAVGLASVIGGTLRLAERRLWLARHTRWQLALLLALTALLVGWGQMLEPYELAAIRSSKLGASEFLLRMTVSKVVVLFAVTAAVLTVLWGIRGRFIYALGGWVGLALGVLGGTILVQSRATDVPLSDLESAALRRIDSVAFGAGYRTLAAPGTAGIEPSLWDREVVAQLVRAESTSVIDAWPGVVSVRRQPTRVWYALREARDGDPALIAIADDRVGPAGGVASLRYGDDAFLPGVAPLMTLSRHHARPGAPRVDVDAAAAGVALSSTPRRIAVAWALQNGALLKARPTDFVAWRLDPIERLRGLAPFVDWTSVRLVVDDRDVYWVSTGFLTVPNFPGSRTVLWRGREVGYARPAFVGVVRARGGETHLYLRRDADSLAEAWARVSAPLIEPASSTPTHVAAQLGTSPMEPVVAAQVLQGPDWLRRALARVGRLPYPASQLASLGTEADPFLLPFLDANDRRVAGILRLGGGTEPGYFEADSALTVGTPEDLQQRWDRFPFFQQLRDSIRADQAEFVAGVIRYTAVGDTLVAYQPNYAIGPGGQGRLVLVNLALGPRLGAGRTLTEAWRNLRGEIGPMPVGTDAAAQLDQAREWLDRADQALRRGDLLEFGRSFTYLRELLRPGSRLSPPPVP